MTSGDAFCPFGRFWRAQVFGTLWADRGPAPHMRRLPVSSTICRTHFTSIPQRPELRSGSAGRST